MKWTPIQVQSDADALMELFGGFHDGCLRELHLWTEHWVGADLCMRCPGSLDTSIRMVVQRQVRNPCAIELLFREVTRFNFVPTPENYDSIIFGASLLVHAGQVFWSPESGFSPESASLSEATYIACRQASWRDASEWLGADLHLGPGLPEDERSG